MQASTTSRRIAGRWWAYVVLGACGAGLVWYGTAWGPWAYSDGVGYLVSARNLMVGVGLGLVKPSGAFEPLVSHPPLYPLLLAGLGSVGLDLPTAARLIDALTFALLVGACGWMVSRIDPESWAGPATSLLLLINPHVLLLFLSAMAEPLFLLAGFAGLLALTLNLSEDTPRPPVLPGALIGLSILARYPGLSFWLAGAAALLLLGPRGRRRLADLAVFTGLSLGPTGLFWLWSALVRGSTSPRALTGGLDLLGSATRYASRLAQIAWTWKPIPPASVLDPILPPAPADLYPRLVGLSLLLGIAVWAGAALLSARGGARPFSPGPLVSIMGLFLASFLAFFFLGFALTFPTPDVNQRTVSPLLLAVVILLSGLLFGSRSTGPASRWSRAAALLALAAAVAGYGPMTYDLLTGFHRTGSGYTGRAWQDLRLERLVRRSDPSRPLVSNHPEGVLLYADRYPHDLAAYLRPGSGSAPSCPPELDDLFHADGAALILIGPSGDPSQPDLDLEAQGRSLAARCDLALTTGTSQVRLYTSSRE